MSAYLLVRRNTYIIRMHSASKSSRSIIIRCDVSTMSIFTSLSYFSSRCLVRNDASDQSTMSTGIPTSSTSTRMIFRLCAGGFALPCRFIAGGDRKAHRLSSAQVPLPWEHNKVQSTPPPVRITLSPKRITSSTVAYEQWVRADDVRCDDMNQAIHFNHAHLHWLINAQA
jgi:hypothetical protein